LMTVALMSRASTMAEETHSDGPPPPGLGWTWRGPGRCVSHFSSAALPWRQSVSDVASGESPSAPGPSHRPRRRAHRHIGCKGDGCGGRRGDWSGRRDRGIEKHAKARDQPGILMDSLKLVPGPAPTPGPGPAECPRFWVAARSCRAGSDSAICAGIGHRAGIGHPPGIGATRPWRREPGSGTRRSGR